MNVDTLVQKLQRLPANEQEAFFSDLDALRGLRERARCQEEFLHFVHTMWPGFVNGRHHKVMARKFEEIANGTLKRLIINMPPRHTKSEFGSYLLPAWFLGKFPDKKVIQSSNTAELATGFGRKVRNLVDSEAYAKIFPNVNLRHDSKAAGRWAVNKTGEYFAIGVGGTVTGKGADLLIIDDPHSEQEAKLAATNPEIFDSVYEWYTSGPRQRLQPGGAIVVIMCMTGDTRVLMADGSEKLLMNIRPGDMVATYEDEAIKKARVVNWRSNGVDDVFTVQTQSGKILRANKRHPFLVDFDGERNWIRLRDLRPGMRLVATKDAADRLDLKPGRGFAPHARQRRPITARTLMHRISLCAVTACGKVRRAFAGNPFTAKACVRLAIESSTRHHQHQQNVEGRVGSSRDTASLTNSTLHWLRSAVIGATYAAKSLLRTTLELIGTASCASTTAMIRANLGGCFATIAILRSDMANSRTCSSEPLSTCAVTLDEIVSIKPAGQEEVFDVEIERTENFIANGVVSHNTRWSKKDLTGRIIQSAIDREGNDDWEVIDFPAILPSGRPLWPEFWSIEELEALRSELPASKWNAQYQQNPTAEEGAIVKREWWKIWEPDHPPPCDFIIQSWDTAFLKSERSDYSACTTWGVFYKDENRNDAHIILLDAFKRRMEFPELKEEAFRQYKNWEPDAFVVEAKASGAPLIFELRAMGIPVQEFTPSRGNDKIVRINSVADLFSSGKVWAPATRWADELIEEMASFPNSDHDDLVDSTTQALIRFRKGGFIRLPSDEADEPREFRPRRAYY